VGSGHGDVALEGARRERNPGQFLEQLGGTLVGQKLGLGQVHRERRHPRTVLDGGRDPFGEGTALYPSTGTGSAHEAVLGDRALDHHLDHLAALRQHLSANLRTATPARASAAQRDDDTLVRVLGQAVGNAAATRLTSRLAPARLALRARRWFPERWVRGGRLAGVVAILGQVNRWARGEGDEMRCAVELEWTENDSRVIVERAWRIENGVWDGEESLTIATDMDDFKDDEAQEFIDRRLPPDYVYFFLFDGEQLQELAEANRDLQQR